VRKILECPSCGAKFPPFPPRLSCDACGSPLIPRIIDLRLKDVHRKINYGGIWVFKDFLISGGKSEVTLGEGLTPLIKAVRLGEYLGLSNVLIKDESRNPLGTFIDRGSATLMSVALNLRFKKVVVASLGDLGISISAYARKAKIKSYVVMPHSITPSKAYQVLVLADKVEFTSSYEEAIGKVLKTKDSLQVTPLNPYLLDGYRTIYYEIYSELGRHPDVLIVPVGDGALMTALWYALKDLGGKSMIIGVKGCSSTPLLRDISVEKPLYERVIKDILQDSGGFIIEVCDKDVIEAIKLLANSEGLLVEPVGVSSIAGLMKLSINDELPSNKLVVTLITGGALRDASILRLLTDKHIMQEEGLKIGFTKLKILEILVSRGPLHPYAIWKILRDNYGIKISLRVLYQHIEELERLGLIKVNNYERVRGRVRKIYEVTSKGVKLLR